MAVFPSRHELSQTASRVEPALFSEDEFPVHCATCGYLLRALPERRCPECGSTFDPGVLLVREYVDPVATTPWTRRGHKLAVKTAKCMILFLVLGVLIGVIDLAGVDPGPIGDLLAVTALIVIAAYLGVSTALTLVTARKGSDKPLDPAKKRRVLAAMSRPPARTDRR